MVVFVRSSCTSSYVDVVGVFSCFSDVACDHGLETAPGDGSNEPSLLPVSVLSLECCKCCVPRFDADDAVVGHCVCSVGVMKLLLC